MTISKGPKGDRSQFVATLLIILVVTITSFISTSILSKRIAKLQVVVMQATGR